MSKLFFLFIFSLLCVSTARSDAQTMTAAVTAPVLIELFTSQGCSSCPPAENLLNTWGAELFTTKKALPLAFHVDYWDYLGWLDPFSSVNASDRQRTYGAYFQSNSIYTPQMIIQGQVGFNGSDRSRAQQELAQAQVSHLPALDLSVVDKNKTITVQVPIPAGTLKGLPNDSRLCLVVFENGLETSIARGENSGALLKENFVVRSFRSMSLEGFKNGTSGKIILSNPGINPARTGVAVWLQDPRTMKVQGLQWVYPLSN